MTDAVQVFPPGFRVTDADDNPVNNAKIKFREAGPGSPKTVYSDADLSVSLGTVVRTRSDGQPVVSEGSSTTTLIYVGADAYHIEITDENDAIIVPAKDNVKGAAVLAAAAVVIPPLPVITTGSNLTLDSTHNGKLINASGNTLTFTDAVTLDDGWHVWVRNSGSSGQVILSASSGVSFEGQSFTARALLPGEAMLIVSDGTAFRCAGHVAPLLSNRAPILIADRVSSAPVATAGNRYIVAAAFDTFLDHQIIEANGSGFNAYTPPTDCGWVAYVQDEDTYYYFIGSAWVDEKTHLDLLPVPIGAVIAIIEDQKTQNTAAQTLSTGSDQVRTLNTLVYNRSSLVSLSSNRFTLPAGTWEIAWSAPFHVSGSAFAVQSLLYNQSDSSEVKRSHSMIAGAAGSGDEMTAFSMGSAVVTIAASKAFEIRHRVGTSVAGGNPANFATEVYTRVTVRRA